MDGPLGNLNCKRFDTQLYDPAWFNLDMVQEKENRKNKKPSQICFLIVKYNPLRIQCHLILILIFIMLGVFHIIRVYFGCGKQV